MSHKPKSIREIYADSIFVNSTTLAKQLSERGVPAEEIQSISVSVARQYNDRVEQIAKECELDMMAIENAPSPLELFIRCISDYSGKNSLSQKASSLLQEYVRAMNDWK